MQIIPGSGSYVYAADSGDWRLAVGDGVFKILPQVGGLAYASGLNLDNLAALIVEAKAHAIAHGINWSGT